jgi:hypothetical protein
VRARGRLATVLAAAAVAAGALGGAWALQAATLPAPDPGALVAARTMSWLAGYRVVESTFVIGDGRSARSRCVRTWLRVGGDREPAVRLTVGGTTRTIPIGRPYVTASGRQVGKPRGALLARLVLAGCPPILASQIAGLVHYRSSTPVGEARLDGRPAQTLQIWTTAGRVTVYLDAGSKRPLAVALAGRAPAGRARLRLVEPASTGANATAGGA